ncbi:MAG: PQQ-dependent dehydrogenase, methanol/ethanol family [Rhodanobacteraceae bacterium]|nr:MAG: PQQ-dependent dehydrogenase, methanol/ethanol family [Rhodanobacteraceae bacterium]
MTTVKAFCKTALCTAIVAAMSAAAFAATPSYPTVTQATLDNAASNNGWLMYRRDYTSNGYAPFKDINTSNVANLKEVWSYVNPINDQGYESPPIVNGDYMFVTTPKDELLAFEATSGKLLWKYTKNLSDTGLKTVCCDVVNRGVALYGDKVYMATLDNYVVALNAKTGKVVWQKQLIAPDIGYAMTLAPLTVKDKVIVGVSGGEYGARGFIEALNAKTGKEVWKTYTIPAPNQPGGNTWPKGAYKTGGGGAWLTGTYDAATNTLFWGVGNPGPWLATLRPGKNLYTDSVIAMNPATGKIKWHYQYTPNDTWDYDGVNETVMTNIDYQGKHYKALVTASRNGWFYAIDRVNGKLIYAKPFVTATSVNGIKDGQMTTDDALRPAVGKQVFTCPSFLGGKNWWPISVDPETHMAYVPAMHTCMTISGTTVAYKAGLPFLGEKFNVMADPKFPNQWGDVIAIDLNTGDQAWHFPSALPWNDGMVSTAGGLVFSGSADGYLYAFDAKTGKVLWKSPKMTSGIIGVPTTWKVDGKQYVSLWAGWGGATPIWGGDMAKDPAVKDIPRGGHLYVFSL